MDYSNRFPTAVHLECPDCRCGAKQTEQLAVLDRESADPADWAEAHPDQCGHIVVTDDIAAFSERRIGGRFWLVENGSVTPSSAADCRPDDFRAQNLIERQMMTRAGNPPIHQECSWCGCILKRCRGTMKSGERCARRVAPQPGSDFCGQHGRQIAVARG